MKRINLLFLALCALSCSKESVEQNVTRDENIASLIGKLGFNTNSIITKGDSIWVEGDILLLKSKLLKTSPRQATFFGGGYNLVGNANDDLPAYIKYYISPNLSDPNAIQSALEEFENVHANIVTFPGNTVRYVKNSIFLTKVTDPNLASIRIEEYFENSDVYGFAEYPTYIPSPVMVVWPKLVVGNKIHLNTRYWNGLSSAQKKYLVAHEFGHAIGLRHTDWRGKEAESGIVNGVVVGAYTVTNTNNTSKNPDPSSVFNSGSSSGVPNWAGFSYNDIRAIFFTTNRTIIQ